MKKTPGLHPYACPLAPAGSLAACPPPGAWAIGTLDCRLESREGRLIGIRPRLEIAGGPTCPRLCRAAAPRRCATADLETRCARAQQCPARARAKTARRGRVPGGAPGLFSDSVVAIGCSPGSWGANPNSAAPNKTALRALWRPPPPCSCAPLQSA
jgi:hypothetical protein